MPPMRITSRGLAAATVGLVSAVVLAGCSSNSTKPTVLPSLPTTPAVTTPAAVATSHAPTANAPAPPSSTTVPPSVTPIASPKPASNSTALAAADAAIAKAVRSYYTVVNKALRDPAALAQMKTLFGPGCSQCVSDAGNIAQLQSKKWVVTGGTYRISGIKATATDSRSGGATVTYDVVAATIRNSAGKIVASESFHAKRSAGLSVAMVGDRWEILGYVSFGSTK